MLREEQELASLIYPPIWITPDRSSRRLRRGVDHLFSRDSPHDARSRVNIRAFPAFLQDRGEAQTATGTCCVGATLYRGRRFGSGPLKWHSRRRASAGVVMLLRPHMAAVYPPFGPLRRVRALVAPKASR